MFCRCEVGFGAEPNTRTCPVCLAHPGSLPVPNRLAIEWTVKLGLALECEIAERALFHRKNYFYPDNPKGYQISQYDVPLASEGRLVVPGADGDEEVGITRAHLEEDAAKTVHVGGTSGRMVGAEHSDVDFNRGGTPLVEIVSKPDIRSAEQAKRFLQLLRQTVVELGISDAEMEKGTLRCDANVSVREVGETGFRTRTELKNINSFNYIARGIDAEIARQIGIYESGRDVQQETYDYDAATGTLTPHRSKEEAEDYRYFPEPDLVPVEPPAGLVERLRAELPELPGARIRRIEPQVGFAFANELVSTGKERKAELLAAEGVEWRAAANVAMNRGDFLPENAPALAAILQANVTREALDRAFAAAASERIDANDYLAQAAVGDESELTPIVDAILAANPDQVETYRGGKEGVLGFFVGQVMRETGGKADPKVVNRLVREKLAP